jgi:hypothetical protein
MKRYQRFFVSLANDGERFGIENVEWADVLQDLTRGTLLFCRAGGSATGLSATDAPKVCYRVLCR